VILFLNCEQESYYKEPKGETLRKEHKLLGTRYKTDSDIPFFTRHQMSSDTIKILREFSAKIKDGSIRQSEHSACPICLNIEALLIAEIDRFGISCKTVICKGCGLVFNDSFFSADSMEVVYKKFYGKINFGGISPEESFLKRTRPDAFSWKRFAFIALKLGESLKKINTVFEVGCRDGCNLLPFHLAGREVMGCDFDDEYLEVGRKRGINLLTGDIGELIKTDKKADLVILSHVLEHVIDPDKTIADIKQILKLDGCVYVEVPGLFNWNRPRSAFLKEDGFSSTNDFLQYLQCVHNYYFDLDEVSFFFLKNGFKKMYGDEWVRALFTNRDKAEVKAEKDISYNPETSRNQVNMTNKVLNHLKTVESDYQSLRSKVYSFARRYRKIIGF